VGKKACNRVKLGRLKGGKGPGGKGGKSSLNRLIKRWDFLSERRKFLETRCKREKLAKTGGKSRPSELSNVDPSLRNGIENNHKKLRGKEGRGRKGG